MGLVYWGLELHDYRANANKNSCFLDKTCKYDSLIKFLVSYWGGGFMALMDLAR